MVEGDILLSGLVSGVLTGGLYALVAVSFILIYKASGVLNFGHGELAMLGAYFVFLSLSQLGLPVGVGLLVAAVLAGLAGWVLHEGFLRPLIGQPILTMIMVTIAFSLLIRGLIPLIWGPTVERTPVVVPLVTVQIGSVDASLPGLVGFGCACLAIVGLTIFFKYTKTGLAMKAVCEDHLLAEATGISIRRVLNQVWIIAAVLAMVGGLFLSHATMSLSDSVADMALKALPVALLVGLESIPGALLGGVLIGLCETLASLYLDAYTRGGMMETFPFIIMFVVICIRPYGLFGLKRIERV